MIRGSRFVKGFKMYSISKTFTFCYGHRLVGDRGRCRNLHGHTAKATFTLDGNELDKNGMILHFDDLKGTIGKWITDNMDHTLLLSKDDPITKTLEDAGERIFALPFNPTAENLARMLFEKAREFGLPVARVEIWESETAHACYGITS